MTHTRLCLLTHAALLLAMCLLVSGADLPPRKNMKVIYKWRFIDFTWPSEKAREEAIRNKEYYYKNVSAYEINVYKDMHFMTTPRFKKGNPVTFSTISNMTKHGEHLLTPYPDWEHNRLGNCNGLTSVWRTQIDQFGRLWAMDSGTVDIINKVPTRVCRPQVVVFDLNSGKIIARYRLPDSMLDCNSLILGMQVDIRNNNPEDVFVYMTDPYARHLVVLDVRLKKFHRVTQLSFLANPQDGDFYIAGTRVFITDGIFSVALGPVCGGDRRVYYHAFGSREECWVMASTIRDEAYVTNQMAYPDSFFCYSKRRASPSAGEIVTPDGVIFYNQETLNSINCWNTELDYNMENTAIVARNDTTLQGVQAITLVGREVYAVSSRHQLVITDSLSETEINFRVLKGSVDALIRGTPCEKPCPRNEPVWKPHSEY